MLPLYFTLINDNNNDKLEYIYKKYYGIMFNTANNFLHDEKSAEDIVHEAILKIIDCLDNIDINNPLTAKSFIYIITKNKALDFLRHKNKLKIENIDDVDYNLEDNILPPLEYIIVKNGYEDIIGYILTLDDIYKDVCQLKYINEMTEAEIAKVLNITVKAVNSRIFRGRQILKKMIAEGDKNGE